MIHLGNAIFHTTASSTELLPHYRCVENGATLCVSAVDLRWYYDSPRVRPTYGLSWGEASKIAREDAAGLPKLYDGFA